MPYTPIELMASTSSTATGRSATCSGVRWWKIETTGPTGMIAKATKAGAADSTGATTKISLSTVRGMMSSFSGSLSASAIGCSRPNGPARFGPGRFCIRPMTRRSAQIMNMRRQQQEDEDDDDLEQHQPPGELVEAGERRVGRGRRQHVRQRPLKPHSGLLRVTMAPCPAPSRARMVGPAWTAGSV